MLLRIQHDNACKAPSTLPVHSKYAINLIFIYSFINKKEKCSETWVCNIWNLLFTQEEDIIDILQTYLPYQDVSIDKNRLDEANQKLQDVRDQLEMVVKRLQS